MSDPASLDFHDVRRFDSIDSTNRYLLEEARAGAPAGVVAVADFQTAGRGRLGRSWEAPAGANLLLSVLLRPVLPADERYLATAAVALAALDATGALPDAGGIGIKWPNDLVDRGGRKVAGVLAEADLTANGPAEGAVVVGIGINVNWPASDADLPPELVGAAVSLQQLSGGPVDREAVLQRLLDSLRSWATDLGHADGRQRMAARLATRCTTIGARVRVELPDEVVVGTATGLTASGHLLVDPDEADTGIRTIVAGDVVHLRPGPTRQPPGT